MWFFFLFLLVKPIYAQNTENIYNKYRTDYLYQLDQYQKKYLDYLNKKDIYTQYRSLGSEKDQENATKTALYSRNLVLKSYLMTLRVALDQYLSANPTDTQKTQIELKKWEDWLDEQNLIVPNLSNSTDIRDWAQNFNENYISIQNATNQALLQSNFNLRQNILNQIQSLAISIRNNPLNQHFTDDWYANFPVKSDLINKSFSSAKEICQPIQDIGRFTDCYSDAKLEINRADTYLKNLLNDLKAITIKFN